MKIKDFMLGVGVGLATAIVIKEVSQRVAPYLSADDILHSIKEDFKKQTPIDGSWIYMKPETFSNGYTEVPVYRGGISRLVEGAMQTFEFSADARSGAIVELNQVS